MQFAGDYIFLKVQKERIAFAILSYNLFSLNPAQFELEIVHL